MKSTAPVPRPPRVRVAADASPSFMVEPWGAQRFELYLRAVVDASSALMAADLGPGLRKVVEVLGECTGIDRVYVHRFDHEQAAGYCECERCAPGIAAIVEVRGVGPYAYCDYEEVWRPLMDGEVYSSVTREKGGFKTELDAALGTRRDALVPIFTQGVFWGCIGFDNCTFDRPFTDPELQVLRAAAAAIAAAVTRDALERTRLRAAHEKQIRAQRWLEISGEGTWGAVIDPPVDIDLPEVEQVRQIIARGVLSECNDHGARNMGYRDAADWIGRRAEEFFPANEANRAYLSAFIRSGYDLRESESNDGARDGVDRWFLNNLRGVVQARQLVALCGTHRDISALKRAEAATLQIEQTRLAEMEASNAKLRDREALLETVTVVARLLLDREDFDAAVNATMEALGRAVRVDRAALIKDLPNPPGISGPSRWMVTHTWNAPGLVSQMEISREGVHPSEAFCEQQRAGRPVVIDYPSAAADYRTALHAIGAYSTLVVPVMVDGAWWGCIGFDDGRSDRVWAAHEIATLETAAACVAAAIRRQEQARAHIARRARYIHLLAAVGEAAAELLAAENIAPCIERAMARVGETSWADRVCVAKIEWTPADARVLGYQEIVHEWTKRGAPRQMDGVERRFAMRRDDPTWETLRRELRQAGHLLANIAEAGEPFRSEQKALGIVWNLCCPIYVEGELWGLMGFDYGRPLEDYDTADRSALMALANALAAALDRQTKERKRLEAERKHLETERARAEASEQLTALLQVVVSSARELLDAKDFEPALLRWLGRFGAAMSATRATFYDMVPHAEAGRLTMRMLVEWVRLGVTGSIPVSFASPYVIDPRGAEEVMDRMTSGRQVVFHTEEARGAAREFLASQGNASVVAVPLFLAGRQYGCMSLDFDTHTEPTPAILAVLQTAADTLASILAREEAVRAMLDERERAANARLEAREHMLAVLRAGTTTLAQVPDLQQFLAGLMQQMIRQIDGWDAQLFLYDSADESLRASIGIVRGQASQPAPGLVGDLPVSDRFPANITKAWRRLIEKRGAIYFDLERDANDFWPGTAEWHRARGHKGSVCIALMLGDEPLGMLGFICPGKDVFTTDELSMLAALAEQASLAIAVSRLAEQAKNAALAHERQEAAQQRADELEGVNWALRRAIADLVSIGDLHDFLTGLLRESMRTVGAQTGAVALIKGDEIEHVVLFDCNGPMGCEQMRQEGLQRVTFTPELRAFAEELNRQDISYAIDPEQGTMPASFRDFHRRVGNRAIRLAPLRAGDSLLGWMGLGFGADAVHSVDKMTLLRGLGDQMALAVELTRLAAVDKTAAVNREREEAAQRRVAELAAANDTLRRATAGLVADAGISPFLCALMAETTLLSGAKTAGIFTYDDVTERLRMFALTTGGVAVDIASDPRMVVWREDVPEFIARKWIEQMRTRDFASFDNHTAAGDHPWPISRAWHIAMGHRHVITVPLYAGGRLVGTFGQCFADGYDVASFDFGMTRVLANHAALALHMMKLSREARDAATAAAVLRERNRIARDLHDTLAQGFAGVIAQLGAAEGALDLEQSAGARAYVERAKALARLSLTEARTSVHALRPSGEALPLTHRLKRLTQDMAQGLTLACSLTETGTPWTLSPSLDWCAYKFVQEALANTMKHSGATRFDLELEWSECSLCVSARDNGCGLTSTKPTRGLGMLSMAERAAEVAGVFRFEPGSAGGLIVSLELPRTADVLE